jgi:hypothetical protein
MLAPAWLFEKIFTHVRLSQPIITRLALSSLPLKTTEGD